MLYLGKHSISCPGGQTSCLHTCALHFNHPSSKCFWAIKSWERPILHLNNYLSKFFIINFFNIYSVSQVHIIILLFSGSQPIFQPLNQIYQRLVALSGPARICPWVSYHPVMILSSSFSLLVPSFLLNMFAFPVKHDFIFCLSYLLIPISIS